MFIPEMLCSLEVDYIAAILLPCEDIGQGDFVPLAAVILVERLIFTGSPPAVFHVESGGWDLLLCQMYGDLVAVLPADKQTENQADNLGGFLVDYPKILVVRVFDITSPLSLPSLSSSRIFCACDSEGEDCCPSMDTAIYL